jgi:hypothetical protein
MKRLDRLTVVILATLVALAAGCDTASEPSNSATDIPTSSGSHAPFPDAAGSPAGGAAVQPSADPAHASFTSELYGYSMELPGGWSAAPATRRWSRTDPLDQSPSADVFEAPEPATPGVEPRPRFSLVATAVPDKTDPRTWIAANVPSRVDPERICRSRGVSRGKYQTNPEEWKQDVIDDRAVLIREECGFVDGVVVHDDSIYALSYDSDTMAPIGNWLPFRYIAGTIAFAEP